MMIYDPVFQFVVFATVFAFGAASEHIRLKLILWRKRQRRFGSFRKEPEPVWAKWTTEHAKGLRR